MLLSLDIFLIQTVQKAKEKKETTESTCEYKYFFKILSAAYVFFGIFSLYWKEGSV